MPGEEQEDIVMTSTQSTILNITCPLSGKPITELAEPVCGYCFSLQYYLPAVAQLLGILDIAELFKMEAFLRRSTASIGLSNRVTSHKTDEMNNTSHMQEAATMKLEILRN
ncbi:unnamed protein product [Dovyalis caffra]|uniref:Uncharacterized protein n=1 Tax=Dovyalis caffra TaxID=77055 RepID=A0AAV1QQF0_9ROSI|nr:unnamed protein product [Dovyalis caffra]